MYQVFQRVPCPLTALPDAQDEARFAPFKSTVLPVLLSGLNGSCQPHTALFIPSYYDYVRVRNELLRREQVK
jgi:Utp25, U3 small nucleolar RNA-associated SSU processome protein 25